MDVIELWLEIASYISTNERAACALVSKAWYETFNPMVYNSLRLTNKDDTDTTSRGLRPSSNALERYGSCIKELGIRIPCSILDEIQSGVQNLNILCLHGKKSCTQSDMLEIGKILVQYGPQLQQLQFMDFYPKPIPRDCSRYLWLAGFAAPQLKKVEIINCALNISELVHIVEQCQQLTLLSVGGCVFTGPWPELPKDVKWSRSLESVHLQHNLGFGRIGFFYLSRYCAGLKRLLMEDELRGQDAEPKDISESLLSSLSTFQYMPRLHKLHITGVVMTDEELAEVLGSCPKVFDLDLGGFNIGRRTFEALTGLYGAPGYLNLVQCEIRTWMCEHIRYHCPYLLYLSLPNLDADMVSFTRYPDLKQPVTINWSWSKMSKEDQENEGKDVIQFGLWKSCFNQHMGIRRVRWSEDVDQNNELMRQLSALGEMRYVSFGIMTFEKETEVEVEVIPELSRLKVSKTSRGGRRGSGVGARNSRAQAQKVKKRDESRKPWKQGRFNRSDIERDPDLHFLLKMWPKLKQFNLTVLKK